MEVNDYFRVYNEILRWSACMPEPVEISTPIPDLESIPEIVCELFDLDQDVILSKTRKGTVIFYRQLIQATAVAFMNYYNAPYTLDGIAEATGGLKHCSIINSAKQVRIMVETKYRIDEIDLLARKFDLFLSDYLYSPRMVFVYGNLEFKSDTETLRFDTTSDAAKYFKSPISTVYQSLSEGHRFKRKYHVTYDIIRNNYDRN